MHNRVRMITASFLIKDLLVPWQTGEAWFWDTLVDADLGNNAGGWQWGRRLRHRRGALLPHLQSRHAGREIRSARRLCRRWVPELAKLPDKRIHRPWRASDPELAAAGGRFGRDYPLPIVDHAAARARALDAFARVNAAK